MSSTAAQARSIYRSILRELPQRTSSTPSPLRSHIRRIFASPPSSSGPAKSPEQQLQETEQYVQYAKAQRVYATLLERYNPGMFMDEENRVKLTMRRVGMNAPEEWKGESKE